MDHDKVFQENKEINRLKVQNRLLKSYEQPVYDRLIGEHSKPTVLDVGCNNGSKSVERFADKTIQKLIGLESLSDLAAAAQKTYGNDKFAFYQCDVEEADFENRLCRIMEQHEIEAFDVINISFVLMHLKDPRLLLKILHSFLAPGGFLFVVEPNDSISVVSADEEQLFRKFLQILYQDPYSGDRDCGTKVSAFLEESGYQKILVENILIHAKQEDLQKKSIIFETFFSYLQQDVLLLQREEPDNCIYADWKSWVDEHFEQLQDLILGKNTRVSMGISIITCQGD